MIIVVVAAAVLVVVEVIVVVSSRAANICQLRGISLKVSIYFDSHHNPINYFCIQILAKETEDKNTQVTWPRSTAEKWQN